jgi:hypothetical protein
MDIELQRKLTDRFDFYQHGGEPAEPFYFGFECDDGWFRLLWTLSEGLEKTGFNGQVTQVKEKYGGLRFYVSYATDEQYNLIDKAEEVSLKVCEVCGRLGKTRGYGWLKTLCDNHYEEIQK